MDFERVYFLPPHDLQYICRGKDGCGMPLTVDDLERHRRHHELLGGAVDLSGLGGANDVPPLPSRG
jgi:hypothetical protein